MILSSTQHLLGGLNIHWASRQVVVVCSCVVWDMGSVVGTATSSLATSGSSKADVCVTNLVQNAAIAVVIEAGDSGVRAGLPEGNAGLQNRALHVVDEDSEVAGHVVLQLAVVAVVWGRELGRSVGILAVATGGNVGGVECTTELHVGTVIATIGGLAGINELRPVLDLHSVVLAVSQVRNGRCGSEMLVESMVGLHNTIGSEDGHVVIVVADKLGGVDPPAADTLLGVVQLKVVPCVELDSEHHVQSGGAALEATVAICSTATVVRSCDSAQSTYHASTQNTVVQ